VQRGLDPRAYHAGRLSVRREAGEHLFHRLLYSDVKAAPREDKPDSLNVERGEYLSSQKILLPLLESTTLSAKFLDLSRGGGWY